MRYTRNGGTRITGKRIIAKIAILADTVTLITLIIDNSKFAESISGLRGDISRWRLVEVLSIVSSQGLKQILAFEAITSHLVGS
jgi:hypothetical protein